MSVMWILFIIDVTQVAIAVEVERRLRRLRHGKTKAR